MKLKPVRLLVPKRSKNCMGCLKSFLPKTEYVSMLIVKNEDEEELERKDFCMNCWEGLIKDDKALNKTTHWFALVPTQEIKELEDKSQDEQSIELLKKLLSSQTVEDGHLAFVLALYLERKHQIMLRKEFNDNYYYEIPINEEVLCVPRVDVDKLRLDDLQVKLVQLLS